MAGCDCFQEITDAFLVSASIWDTLPEINMAPENRPGPIRKQSYSNRPFSGAKMLVSGSVYKSGKILVSHFCNFEK